MGMSGTLGTLEVAGTPWESGDYMAAILRAIGDGVTVQDATGRLIYANDAAARTMGFGSGAALLEAPLRELVERYQIYDEAGEPLPAERFPGRRALAGESEVEQVFRFRVRGAAEERWSLVRATPILDGDGRVRYAINVIRDVTDQRREARRAAALIGASHALAAPGLGLEGVLDVVVRHVTEAIGDASSLSLISDDGEWLDSVALYHADPERLAFRRELARETRLRVGEGIAGKVVESGEPFFTNGAAEVGRLAETGLRLRRLAERYPIYGVACAPLRAEGRVIGALAASHDLPTRLYAEEDLALLQELADRAALAVQNARLMEEARAARERAEEAVRQRDTFISVAGHELRTPLTSLRGYAQQARRDLARGNERALDPQRADGAWDRVERQTRRIERLVAGLLDLTSIQSGRLTLDRREWELRALVETVVEEARLRAVAHEIHVRGLEEVGGTKVLVDRARVEQVLVNVLDNAVKYSPEGGEIEMTVDVVDVVDEGESGEVVRVSLRDHGLGIPAERLPHVFEPYYRAHGDGTAGAQGMGLGLYVCKEIVELHGGTISVTCPDGGGTCVTVTLPVGVRSAAER